MSDRYSGTVVTLYAAPRWWQLLRRFRQWRRTRALIGQELEVGGQRRTITRYDSSSNVITLNRALDRPSLRDQYMIR